MRTKTELKRIAQGALKSEYGFGPKLGEITLLEASGDGTYIRFTVHEVEYLFDSSRSFSADGTDLGVWVGAGTLKKIGGRYGRKSA